MGFLLGEGGSWEAKRSSKRDMCPDNSRAGLLWGRMLRCWKERIFLLVPLPSTKRNRSILGAEPSHSITSQASREYLRHIFSYHWENEILKPNMSWEEFRVKRISMGYATWKPWFWWSTLNSLATSTHRGPTPSFLPMNSHWSPEDGRNCNPLKSKDIPQRHPRRLPYGPVSC